MKRQAFFKLVLYCSLMVLIMLSVRVRAQSSTSRRGGLYGAIPIKKVNLEGDQVSFKIILEFGDQKFEMSFEGKVEDSKLTGELTSSRGSQKIKGTKVIRTSRRRSGM